ncbi:hypothetical protein GCM10010840_27670 [Deinococcus aerolatus]|uniref:DUF3592 domain-containing protein n=1 Tax=Deinococcus aerolatus TaxID=522487 RepID=A0ABQ2GDK4_9DEIO|nr:DUF3592 domain-containing protein [Deinococcus aerolatus]GGL88074.1 hypothetical protein GCM10010840_27670 [Deinococcus aerolatus]
MIRILASWPLERVVGLGILSVTLMFALGLGGLAHLGHRTLTWPTTPGTVTDSRLSRSLSGEKERYTAHVESSSAVGGQGYRSQQVTRRSSPPDEAFARRVLARYPKGRPVQVHYAPATPGQAVLEPGTDAFILGALAVATVVLLVGGGVFVSTFRPSSTWPGRRCPGTPSPQGAGGVRPS